MNLRDSAARAGQHRLIQLLAVAGLLGACALAIVHAPPLLVIAAGVALIVGFLSFQYPLRALASMSVVRILLDILWWVPFTVAGLRIGPTVTGWITLILGGLVASEIPRIGRVPIARAALLFLALTLFGALRATDATVAMDLVIRIISPLLLAVLIAALLPRGRMAIVCIAAPTIALAIPLVISLSDLLQGDLVATRQGIRVLGAYENFRQHGMVMALAACLGVFWVFYARGRWIRTLAAVLLISATVVTVMTLIRGAMLSLLTFGAIYLLMSRRRRILGFAVVIVLLAVAAIPEVRHRFADLWLVFTVSEEDLVDVDQIGSGRWGLWRHSFSAFADLSIGDRLLGCGLGGHWDLTRSAFHAQFETRGGRVDTHNDHLWLLYQLGPLAMVTYIYLVIRVFVAGWRLARRSSDRFARELGAAAASMSVTVLVANALSNGFLIRTSIAWLYWSLAGVALAMEMRLPEEAAQREADGEDDGAAPAVES